MIKLRSRLGVLILLLFLNSTLTFAQQPANAKKPAFPGIALMEKEK